MDITVKAEAFALRTSHWLLNFQSPRLDSTFDDRAHDVIEVGEFAFEISITFFEERILLAASNPDDLHFGVGTRGVFQQRRPARLWHSNELAVKRCGQENMGKSQL